MYKIIRKLLGRLNVFTAFLVSVLLIGGAGTAGYILAADTSTFTQVINAGTWSADFVDAGGTTVASPGVTMTAIDFSFDTQDANGELAPSAQRIRANNPTGTAAWSVTIAAALATDLWENGGATEKFDFNDLGGYVDDGATTDTDDYGGEMTIDPSGGTVGGWPNDTDCPVAEVTKGSSDSFEEGATDNITIMTASGSAPTGCRWHFIGSSNNITQKVPASQPADTYTIDLTVTISS